MFDDLGLMLTHVGAGGWVGVGWQRFQFLHQAFDIMYNRIGSAAIHDSA
jgi:hypothetical protein